jgi:quinol-cytochrome oxidoreductase complex cytochrome b subunit
MLYACSVLMIVVLFLLIAQFATKGNPFAKKAAQPITHYQVDETPTYFAWYFLDTLQDDLRNQFQR